MTALRDRIDGGVIQRTREVIEWVPARAEVTGYVSLERGCPHCRGHWQPGPKMAGFVVGQGRLEIGSAADRHLARGVAGDHPRFPPP